MAENNNSTYKESLKATSLFGGVQVVSIIVSIIKSKLVAILIGPFGLGVVGLLQSTTTLVASLTGLGLYQSGVRNISEAQSSGDNNKLSGVISVFWRLIWLTGVLGLIVCAILSPLLSEWTFGNKDYTLAFIILSITLLFQQLTLGQNTIMQGLHKYQFMAKSSVIGNIIGLLVTVPLYYIWRIDAIVPVLVLTSITSLFLAFYYYRKVDVKKAPIEKTVMRSDGKNMLVMGITLSVTSLMEALIGNLIRVYINSQGGTDEVGLFTAGFAIVNTYVGLIFTAMGTDYYPRLSAVNKDQTAFNKLINNQIEISLIILAPVISIFIIFIELIIIILYSDKFLPCEGMMYYAVFGTYFKAFSWCIAFSYLAKGDAKMFVANELMAQLYVLPSQLIGYHFMGITGIGLAYLFNYLLYSLQVYFMCRKRYSVTVMKPAIKIFIEQIPFLSTCLLIIHIADGWTVYAIGLPVILISSFISYKELDKRVNLKESISALINRKNG